MIAKKKGHKVSGYIDYGHRLKTEDFEEYFDRKRKLPPKPADLSYYNWKIQTLSYKNSSTFQVIADNELGSFSVLCSCSFFLLLFFLLQRAPNL